MKANRTSKAAVLGICAGFATAPVAAENLLADIPDGTPEVIETPLGPLRGYADNGVASFLGIPYAKPPVSDLRWRPPERPEPWTEVRDAGTTGNACLQTELYDGFASRSMEEDCLYLDVYAPSDMEGGPYPVMVWLYGGSLINGRAADYDGRLLAGGGKVIVVTLNYRLNVFGYFAHPALTAEGPPFGNYGTLDQQQALRWVQENIEGFGGDPSNVTLFGESAGGLATLFNMVSPSAEGLFHKAILQSGVSAAPQTPLDVAEERGLKLSGELGCTSEDLAGVAECMRSKTVEEIEAAEGDYTAQATRVVDGTVLPDQMQTLIAEGEFMRIPILMGNNHNEWSWFVRFGEAATGEPLQPEGYRGSFAGRFGEEGADKIVEEFPLEDYASPSVAASVVGTAGNFICPSLRVARAVAQHVPLWVYEFMDDEAPFYFEEMSYPFGAAHTLDIQYLFPMFHGAEGTPKPLNENQQKLSEIMVGYWSNFARTGDPNGGGLPEWPRWTPDEVNYQLLDAPEVSTASDTGIDRKCQFWDTLSQ